MKEIYAKGSANYPRIETDKFFADYENKYKYTEYFDRTFKFIEDFQLIRPDLWSRFVRQFKENTDTDFGWRGEYWGKMMRGACFVYSYTQNPRLYETLCETVRDMISAAEDSGRISSYPIENEFDAWDIWCRKYVLLGMQYFLEICTDSELCDKVKESMCRQLDYIIEHIGSRAEGKKPITSATRNWRGLNSSSLLEPVVRLYSLTGRPKYLNFAHYIVDGGGIDVANIFELAYQNEFMPYQYPVTKAYEMMSCFEGLLEYYRIVGNEKNKIAVINFADRILESDFTVIGSCGCTHELFDHSSARQANTTNGKIMQETCVTVTLMKFLYQVHLITGDPKYVDAFEISLYNAYLGAVNTEKVIEPMIKENHPDWNIEALPFDSYSPLTAGTRGNGIGGLKLMPDKHYYGCCACIGSAGIGLVPKMQLLTAKGAFVLNLFIDGEISAATESGQEIRFTLSGGYPKNGKVTVKISLNKAEKFTLLIRNPEWSNHSTRVLVNSEKIDVCTAYVSIERVWKDGDTVEIELDMRTKVILPTAYGSDILMNNVVWSVDYTVPSFDKEDPIAKDHIALRRGPIMLAQENRLGYSVDAPADILVKSDGYVDAVISDSSVAPYDSIIEMQIPLKDGKAMTVTNYASAGKLWTEESKMAVWMLIR
ncbi:MAG: glycoside hydrolase family 127 protein [Clostridia bacterium]|nr:glycoside hydrolase family 127 protein [Clostridia bacterium]